jgi:hypothetical protein
MNSNYLFSHTLGAIQFGQMYNMETVIKDRLEYWQLLTHKDFKENWYF